MERDLGRAIERDELRLVYQPIYSLTSLQAVSVETLIRWNHPTMGTILSSEFLPIAKETGLIEHIGGWTLQESCRQLRQ